MNLSRSSSTAVRFKGQPPAPCAQRLLPGARHAARPPRSPAYRTVARGTKACLECLSISNVFAIGNMGSISHYNVNKWTLMYDGLRQYESFSSIWGSSESNVIVGGLVRHSSEKIRILLRYDGSKWQEITPPNLPYLVLGSTRQFGQLSIWGSSKSDVFAVGARGTILHYDGNNWNRMESGNGWLYAVIPRSRRLRVQCHCRIGGALARAEQGAMLALAEQGGLGAGQHQRETRGEVRPCHGPPPAFPHPAVPREHLRHDRHLSCATWPGCVPPRCVSPHGCMRPPTWPLIRVCTVADA